MFGVELVLFILEGLYVCVFEKLVYWFFINEDVELLVYGCVCLCLLFCVEVVMVCLLRVGGSERCSLMFSLCMVENSFFIVMVVLFCFCCCNKVCEVFNVFVRLVRGMLRFICMVCNMLFSFCGEVIFMVYFKCVILFYYCNIFVEIKLKV